MAISNCSTVSTVPEMFQCVGEFAFWNDPVYLGIVSIIIIAWLGFTFRLPAATMSVMVFGAVMMLYFTFQLTQFTFIIALGVIFFAIQVVNALYKAPKQATQ